MAAVPETKAGDLLDTGSVHHLMGYLLAMASVQTRRAFQDSLGTPFDLRTVEFTLLILLLQNSSVATVLAHVGGLRGRDCRHQAAGRRADRRMGRTQPRPR